MANPSVAPLPPAARRSDQREWRRQQLLDATAAVLVERGRSGVTMEAVAARAGVSKALPYRHFANADDAVAALYEREMLLLGRRVYQAARSAEPGDGALGAAVAAYFDAVVERSSILAVIAGRGSDVPALAPPSVKGPPRFLVELLMEGYGLDRRSALLLTEIMISIVTAASDSLARGVAGRRSVQSLTTAAVIGAAHAVAAETNRSTQR